MKAFLFLLVVLTTNIAIALSNFPHFDTGKIKGRLSLDSKINVMNTANGGFPANPSYLVYQQYEDFECNTLEMAVSALLDTCMSSSTGSIKYTCANGVAHSYTYSDTDCTTLSDDHELSSTCNPGPQAKLLTCTTSDPFALGDGDYFTESIYQNNGCSNVLGANGFVNGLCIPADTTESIKFDWPVISEYSASNTCSGVSSGFDVSLLGCSYMGTDDDDAMDYDSYLQYSYVSNGGSSSNDLSTGAVVGIAVGGAAGAALIGAGLYWYLAKAKAPMSAQGGIEQTNAV